MELNPLLKNKNSNSETNLQKKAINYTSPQIQEYHKIATKYQKYIEQLNPRIETICQKQNYRTYLKETKLLTIKTQLAKHKIELQTKLQQKKDPTKSTNGPLHLQIKELNKLENNYRRIKESLQQNVTQKQQECKQILKKVKQQTHIIKDQLKQSFANYYLKEKVILPQLIRNMSDSAFLTRQRSQSHLSRSRESVMYKLNQTIEQKMIEKLTQEEQKLMLLKLLAIYARSDQNEVQSHLNIYLINEIQRDIEAKTKLIQEVKTLIHT